jgi:hypothetical protein
LIVSEQEMNQAIEIFTAAVESVANEEQVEKVADKLAYD